MKQIAVHKSNLHLYTHWDGTNYVSKKIDCHDEVREIRVEWDIHILQFNNR